MTLLKRISSKAKNLPRNSNLIIANMVHQFNRGEHYEIINRIMARHHQAGGLKNPIQPYKLWSLHELLELHKPKSIIEFGSGLSTVMLSEYSKKTGARVLSIDEEEQWAANTRRLVDNPAVDIITSPRKFLLDKNPPEIKYDFNTDEYFEMAIIDGPNIKVDGKRVSAINSNVFDLPQLPKIIVVDGRKETSEFLAAMTKYEAQLSDLLTKKYVFLNYRHFSVFIRKD